jgi:hypothetical protein
VAFECWHHKHLTVDLDYSQVNHKDAKGMVQQLLDSNLAINGNIIGTRHIPMAVCEYPLPHSLVSHVVAWKNTNDEQYCKWQINLPRHQLQWVTAVTYRAFGAWVEEHLGFCVYIDVVIGLVWVVIAKPKEQGGQIFADISTSAKPFNPDGSNSQLWDVEAILLGEGSQL